ncbi:RNase J family beta-CASP ribonuclease [Berryella intestinalis]|nr:RNase J family beta-CASP ribonuclease [Berryella intestinalis]
MEQNEKKPRRTKAAASGEAKRKAPSSEATREGAATKTARKPRTSRNSNNKTAKAAVAKRATARAKGADQLKSRTPKRTGSTDKNPRSTMKIIPLGGLDAIGKNMTVFECDGDMILDDAGLMFPDDDHPGIDLILPDYTYVLENAHRLKGIFITHGHEDHTGSLPYLYKDLDRPVPIYGTKLTLGLIEGKFAEHRIKNAKLVEIKPGDRVKLGCIEAEFFAVNHSIPGSVGIFYQTPAGNVLHTGDFKLDQSPVDGVHTDFAALSRYNEIGVDLMLSDSTNSMNNTFTPSESEVGKALMPIIAQAKGRVIVASFASHIHRLQQICDAAVANGRKVVVTGRSMIQNTEIARRLGYLKINDEDLVDAYDLKGIPPEKIVVMCTGSQGEPLSALSRIAGGSHKTVSIEEGDTVIISATPVPGNEKAVTRIVNMLAKIGADVYDKRRALVHVSGHASAEELKIVLSIVRPVHFMPVHGEATHLRAHAKLAEATGVDPKNIFILENGESLELTSRGVKFGETVQSGVVFVDGLSVGDTSQVVLDDRSQLASQGFAAVAAAVSYKGKRICGDVLVEMRGITGGDDPYLVEEAVRRVAASLKKQLEQGGKDTELKRAARDSLSSVLWERTKQRPMVVTSILDI